MTQGNVGVEPAKCGGPTELIVPIDLSAQPWHALPFALSLGERLGVRARAVHIDTRGRVSENTVGPVVVRADVRGRAIAIEVVAASDTAEAIEQFVAARPGSSVVMATHGRSGVGWLVRGNVCRDLLDRAATAIVAIGPRLNARRHTTIRRIVVGLDPTAPDLSLATDCSAWAATLQVPLTVLSVVRPSVSAEATQAGMDDLAAVVAGLRSSQAAGYDVVRSHDPGAAIASYADEVAGTLVGLAPGPAHEGHTTTASVSMHVAREGHTPMLLRPRMAQYAAASASL